MISRGFHSQLLLWLGLAWLGSALCSSLCIVYKYGCVCFMLWLPLNFICVLSDSYYDHSFLTLSFISSSLSCTRPAASCQGSVCSSANGIRLINVTQKSGYIHFIRSLSIFTGYSSTKHILLAFAIYLQFSSHDNRATAKHWTYFTTIP